MSDPAHALGNARQARNTLLAPLLLGLISVLLLIVVIQLIPSRFGLQTPGPHGLSKLVLSNNRVLVGVVERADAHFLRVQEIYQAHSVTIDGQPRIELGIKRGVGDRPSEALINDRHVLLIEPLDPQSPLGQQVLKLRNKLLAVQNQAQEHADAPTPQPQQTQAD